MNGENYEVITPNEADPKGATIRKTGITADFTVAGMEGEQLKLQKVIKELTAKQEFAAAKRANIEEHHPFVKDLDEQQLFTVHMYYEEYAIAKGLPEKIAELQAQLDASYEEQKHIAEVLGIPELAIKKSAEEAMPADAVAEAQPEGEQELTPPAEAAAIEDAEQNAVAVAEAGGPEPTDTALANPQDAEPLANVGDRVEFIGEGELAGFHTVTEVIPGNADAGTHPAYKTDRSTEPQKARNFRSAPEDVTPNDQA